MIVATRADGVGRIGSSVLVVVSPSSSHFSKWLEMIELAGAQAETRETKQRRRSSMVIEVGCGSRGIVMNKHREGRKVTAVKDGEGALSNSHPEVMNRLRECEKE